MSAYATVVLDVDSTLSAIEGIDWLAALRGPDVAARIGELTDAAMRGTIPLEQVYGGRLAAIRPTRGDIEALSSAYIAEIAPGAADTVGALRRAGVRVIMVSGGIRQAILPLAEHLGVPAHELHAVDIYFGDGGAYAGFDEHSPLATSAGKPEILSALSPPRPILAVGDGSTDLAMKSVADSFAAYTGFAARTAVVEGADMVIGSFAELEAVMLGGRAADG